MGYRTLAEVYDTLMDDVDYNGWAEYLHSLLQDCGCPGNRVLDLGCGTGNITIPLAERGYCMTGVDLSEEMLEKARSKETKPGPGKPDCAGIQWHAMDITDLTLEWDSYDAVIATFDVMNHLTEETDVQMLFQDVSMLLADDGLFLFDIQTPYRLQTVQGNETYSCHRDDMDYFWENHYDPETEICYMDLTFFLKEEDGRYRKMTEHQEERSYDPELLQMWLSISGFDVLGVYGELSRNPLADTDWRAVIVARRKSFEEDFDEDWSEADEDSVF